MAAFQTHLTVTQDAATLQEADERLGAALDRHWLAIATWTTFELDESGEPKTPEDVAPAVKETSTSSEASGVGNEPGAGAT